MNLYIKFNLEPLVELSTINYDFYFSKFFPELKPVSQIDNYIKSDRRKKIVVIDFNLISHLCMNEKPDLSWADLIIIRTVEVFFNNQDSIDDSIKYLYNFFNNKNIIVIHASLFSKNINHPNCFFIPSFPLMTFDANKNIDIDFKENRKYIFDCLFGTKRHSRELVFEFLKNNNLLDKSIVSMKNINGSFSTSSEYETPDLKYFENEEMQYIKEKNPKNHSGTLFTSLGYPFACKISPKIYENSWYSIINETWVNAKFGNNLNSITEKTAKCFMAKRVFVCFSLPEHLSKIHDLGFETFHEIIDESYDKETNVNKRIKMACEQLLWLSKTNPLDVYKKAKPILEHNYNQMKILKNMENDLKKFIDYHVNKLKNPSTFSPI